MTGSITSRNTKSNGMRHEKCHLFVSREKTFRTVPGEGNAERRGGNV